MTITTPLTPRVLFGASERPLSLRQHEETFAPSPALASMFDQLEASGLTGRGGAAFLTSRKVALLREQRSRHKCVVVNAMEGEPAAHKDRTLLSSNPHLVLDGAEYLATMIGARRVDVCVSRDDPTVVNHVGRALHERDRRGRGPELVLHTPPWRYVAGEESALAHWLNDNETLPQYRPKRPDVLHLNKDAALVVNAETCAHVGLIGRFGAAWFRELGTPQSPGSTLVSVSGAVEQPIVLEVPLGTSIRSILRDARADPDPLALLTGGYGGAWLSGEHIDLAYCDEALRPLGAGVGAGILVVVPRAACGLAETHRIVRWMANESSRQCGPCAFGLPALADDLGTLLQGSRDPQGVRRRLEERCAVIDGRGACRHPDGVVRLVQSALEVFTDDVDAHSRRELCAGANATRQYVSVPALQHESQLVWQ